MTPAEATAVADRITHIPGRQILTRDEWITQLLPLDHGTAGTALIRCLGTRNAPPALDEFLRKYHDLNTPANNPIPGEHCGCGDGLVTVWIERGGRQIRCAAPCPNCALGRSRAPQIEAIAAGSVLSQPDPTTPHERVDHLPTDLFHQEQP